jgi:hypothetical protein
MTDGIEGVFLQTHSWAKSSEFFQKLGFTVEFETELNTGRLRNGDGPFVFIAQVPEDQPPQTQLIVAITDEQMDALEGADIRKQLAREMTLYDPDGRSWRVQTPEST